MSDKIVIVSDYYYPDDISTGYFLTGIAEELARYFPVEVICGHPAEGAMAARTPSRELWRGVAIRRHRSLGGKDRRLLSRIVRNLHFGIVTFFSTLSRLHRGDRALVVSNPPILPHFVALACRLRGARCVLLIHDVYPDVLIASGLAAPHSILVTLLSWMNRRLYVAVEQVIVLGRDIKRTVEQTGCPSGRIVIIPNWGDTSALKPALRAENSLLRQLGLQDKFVVQFSGNFGRTHDVKTVFECARRIGDNADIHFLFAGWGVKYGWLTKAVGKAKLRNVTLLGRQPRGDLSTLLNAADLQVIGFIPGMAGVSVPSRLYNMMAAGKPILAATDLDSELAMVIKDERIGWTVPPQDPIRMVEAIMTAYSDRKRLSEMGARARQAAERKYSQEMVLEVYRKLFSSLQIACK